MIPCKCSHIKMRILYPTLNNREWKPGPTAADSFRIFRKLIVPRPVLIHPMPYTVEKTNLRVSRSNQFTLNVD